MSGVNGSLDWVELNQRELAAQLTRVLNLLARHLDQGTQMDVPGTQAEVTPSPDDLPQSALARLCDAFGLSAFERDVLLLCAGSELDARFGPLFASLNADHETAPTFSLALAALPGAHWSALTPEAPLRAWRLIELAGTSPTRSSLRIDERVLHFLAGINYLDARLRDIAVPLVPLGTLHGGDASIASRVARVCADQTTAVQLTGPDGARRLSIAAAACAALDSVGLLLQAEDLPASPADRACIARLVARESLLGNTVAVIDMAAGGDEGRVTAFVDALRAPALILAREPLSARDTRDAVAVLSGRTALIQVPPTTRGERVAEWRDALGEAALPMNGALDAVCGQFDLDTSVIQGIASRARETSRQQSPDDTAQDLWDACRLATRPRLEGLAQRIEPDAAWGDLVLPEPQMRVLRDIATHVRQRGRVYEDWGFAAKSSRGLGITALLAGAPGTGKTMAAEVLARELRLDLYRIDLANVVSKYIGETEKNLKRLFDAAEGGGAILLFDEADALFGRRSEVKDSHDRYANIEVSYLLQRMESYRGLAILTTNMKQALDPAFLRRLRFVVQFPFPDAAHRAGIWRGIFPAATPVSGLNYERLAQLNVPGGHIRNIALASAFIAADRDEPVGMAHVADAARAEYAKLDRTLSDSEIRGWV